MVVASRPPRFPGPGPRDWLLFGGSAVFCAVGAWLLPREPRPAIAVLTFFGVGAAAFGFQVVRKLRARRQRPLQSTLVGGVLIRPSRLKAVLLAGALLSIGVAFGASGDAFPWLMHAIGWLSMGIGMLLLGGIVLGWVPVGGLRFDPEGITIHRAGWCYLVAWDNIAALAGGELHDHPVLLLRLHDPAAVPVQPEARRRRFVRQLESTRTYFAADVAVMTGFYPLDLHLLLPALQRYVADPEARTELVPPTALRLPERSGR